MKGETQEKLPLGRSARSRTRSSGSKPERPSITAARCTSWSGLSSTRKRLATGRTSGASSRFSARSTYAGIPRASSASANTSKLPRLRSKMQKSS